MNGCTTTLILRFLLLRFTNKAQKSLHFRGSSKETLTNPQQNLRNPKKSQGNLSILKEPYKLLRTLRSPKKPEDP